MVCINESRINLKKLYGVKFKKIRVLNQVELKLNLWIVTLEIVKKKKFESIVKYLNRCIRSYKYYRHLGLPVSEETPWWSKCSLQNQMVKTSSPIVNV